MPGVAVSTGPFASSPGSVRVLVVDDEPMVRDVLCRYLERGGVGVETAEDGEQALAAIRASRLEPSNGWLRSRCMWVTR